jgi:hypothetical protein
MSHSLYPSITAHVKSWCSLIPSTTSGHTTAPFEIRNSSLTRGRVCLLYTCMVLALASVVFLGSESLGTRDHILLSHIWGFPFVASYDSHGHGGGIRPRLHTGAKRFSLCVINLRHGPRSESIASILLRSTDHIENTVSFIVACWKRVYGAVWQCVTIYITCICVTIDGVWIGKWIYWPLVHTTRNYK